MTREGAGWRLYRDTARSKAHDMAGKRGARGGRAGGMGARALGGTGAGARGTWARGRGSRRGARPRRSLGVLLS